MGNLLFCIIAFLVSSLGAYLCLLYTKKKAILDLPNERSSHSTPTPRGGGIAIASTWFLAVLVLFVRKNIEPSLFYALLCGIPISIIGLLDDVYTLSPKVRICIQISSAIGAILFLGGISSIHIGFTELYAPVLFSSLAVIGVVWFTNLFNFLDGIDGYISTEVIYIGIAAYIFFGMAPPLILAAITAGFLLWNWQPAKIFMGDVGSTLLGFTIAVFAIYYQNTNEASLIVWLMISSLFWFDATLTLYRRWRNKEKLSKAHKKHAYQRAVLSGLSHQRTVLFAMAVNIPILGLAWLGIVFPALTVPVLAANIAYLYMVVRVVDKKQPFH